jgi:hypothetical protein
MLVFIIFVWAFFVLAARLAYNARMAKLMAANEIATAEADAACAEFAQAMDEWQAALTEAIAELRTAANEPRPPAELRIVRKDSGTG